MRPQNQPWSEADVRELSGALEALAEVEREFQQRKMQIVSQALNVAIGQCHVCHRPMIPRRLWEMLPPSLRVLGLIARKHDGQTCFSHYVRTKRTKDIPVRTPAARRTTRAPLLPHEVEHLRKLVGYQP